MKKLIVLIALISGISQSFAQDLTSKKGEPFLPEEKDWAIGCDAGQIINYVNSFFKTSKAPSTSNIPLNAQTITGKYFKDAKTAYRTSVSLGFNSYNTRNKVVDRVASTNSVAVFPAAVATKENVWKKTSSLFGVSFGIEKRRGKTRLQGLYGAEAGLYISSSKDKFTYGNALSTSSTTPIDVDTIADAMSSSMFGSANNINTSSGTIVQGKVGNARITERKNGTLVSFGLRAFVGAEYFFLPKMSIGGEFGFGLALSSTGRTTTVWQSIGQSINSTNSAATIGTTTTEGSKSGSVKLNTDNLNSIWGASASLRFNFYF